MVESGQVHNLITIKSIGTHREGHNEIKTLKNILVDVNLKKTAFMFVCLSISLRVYFFNVSQRWRVSSKMAPASYANGGRYSFIGVFIGNLKLSIKSKLKTMIVRQ
jgi:hypothetical protein